VWEKWEKKRQKREKVEAIDKKEKIGISRPSVPMVPPPLCVCVCLCTQGLAPINK